MATPAPLSISVIGAGHVGVASAVCLAALGHEVRVLDIDRQKIDRLTAGELPFYEPGVAEVLARVSPSGRISFHAEPKDAVEGAQIVFLCVNTPNDDQGRVDLSALVAATRSVARHLAEGAVLVNRSTAPVGTAEFLRSILREERSDERVKVASNPEFLAEGSAVRDFLAPDRIVIGAWDEADVSSLLVAYQPILDRRLPDWLEELVGGIAAHADAVPLVLADPSTAELVKYAANAFLAVKISFINEMGQIAEEVGADVVRVAEGIGLDRRIGPQFLRAGIGWGGSCFPKDIEALTGIAETRGVSAKILRAANEVNSEQRGWIVRKLQQHLKTLVGKRVALLGLAFKPNTDDLRSSPAVEVAAELSALSMRVTAFDPMVKELPPELEGIVELAPDAETAARDAEALVLVTEWPQFRQLDLSSLRSVMRVPLLLDGRNLFDPEAARAAGFTYAGVGR
ncbi:MAG: UDP-glucose dehydrogenase family protein [Actinomycetota bacterium]